MNGFDILPLAVGHMIGLGAIGRKIARRAAAFGMVIGYHNRRPAAEAGDAHYVDSAIGLAQWADDLVVATPGGAAMLWLEQPARAGGRSRKTAVAVTTALLLRGMATLLRPMDPISGLVTYRIY